MKSFEDEDILLIINFLLPSISALFNDDLSLLLSNKEKIIKIKASQTDSTGGSYGEGDILPHDIPAYLCMKENKTIIKSLSKEYFGVPIKAIATPIKNTNGQIIGSLAIGKRDWGDDISTHAETFISSFNEISIVIDGVSAAIQDLAKSNNDIVNEVNETNEDMNKTDEIISFVQNVSKQTNLLGLNAAIESARAGEMGKGFGVVANEIRNLSSSSSESIKEINSVLNKLKSSIKNITNNLYENNKLFETQAASIEELNSSIAELNNAAQIIKQIAEKI